MPTRFLVTHIIDNESHTEYVVVNGEAFLLYEESAFLGYDQIDGTLDIMVDRSTERCKLHHISDTAHIESCAWYIYYPEDRYKTCDLERQSSVAGIVAEIFFRTASHSFGNISKVL